MLMVSVSGVRGIVGPELNPLVVGRWAAAHAAILPKGPLVIGRDSRPTGGVLAAAAGAALCAMGREVWDVGIVPTPTVQLAVERWGAAGGIIVSASHNPSAWNALKFVDRDGSFLSPDRFACLKQAHGEDAPAFVGAGEYAAPRDRHEEACSLHLGAALALVDAGAIRERRLKVVLEAGHGAGGPLLLRVAEALGFELRARRFEPTGLLPPDPEPNESTLRELVLADGAGADLVGMVDPDADRFGVAVPGSDVVGEEWTLPLACRGRLEGSRGPLVTNLSTSTRLEALGARFGVPVHRTPVGEAHVVQGMRAHGALIGGEGNGGVIDPRAHLGRDSLVALVLLAAAEVGARGGLLALARELPPRFMVKEKISLSDNTFEAMEPALGAVLGSPSDRRDGLWYTLADGFVHVRASNTEPIARLVVETASLAESQERARSVRSLLGSIPR